MTRFELVIDEPRLKAKFIIDDDLEPKPFDGYLELNFEYNEMDEPVKWEVYNVFLGYDEATEDYTLLVRSKLETFDSVLDVALMNALHKHFDGLPPKQVKARLLNINLDLQC